MITIIDQNNPDYNFCHNQAALPLSTQYYGKLSDKCNKPAFCINYGPINCKIDNTAGYALVCGYLVIGKSLPL